MTKPKKITVKYIETNAKPKVKQDDTAIKQALAAKKDASADEDCPFC